MKKTQNDGSWISQIEGIIDIGKLAQPALGTQPIRFLINLTIDLFRRGNPLLQPEIVELVEKERLNPMPDIQFGEVPLEITPGKYHTPRIINETKTITLHETFFSYQWCIVYAVFVLYIENIETPRFKKADPTWRNPDKKYINYAYELFDYAKYLIKDFVPWEIDRLPNPERYLAQEKTYIEQTNMFLSSSIRFIFGHELAHAKLHTEDPPDPSCPLCSQENEFEADNYSIDMMMAGIFKELAPIGVTTGILSMIFFRRNTSGVTHPNVEDRLTNALRRMNADSTNEAWGFACAALMLWDRQFDHNFDWVNEGCDNDEELYFKIVDQIQRKQQK